MIDHFNLPVSDLDRSSAFYERALAALGYPVLMRDEGAVGFGVGAWRLGVAPTAPPFPPMHLAFQAADRAGVDRFYEAALAAGGQSNGAPGVRAHYDPDYYAAYIIDPDGHHIEAVCRRAV